MFFPLEPAQEVQVDDDDDVDFADLNAFDEILSTSLAVLSKEILAVSSLEVQKPIRTPSSPTPANTTILVHPPLVELLINLLSSISSLFNNTFGSLAVDGDAKQSLIDNILLLNKAALPPTIQPLYQSLCQFIEDLLEQIPKVVVAM